MKQRNLSLLWALILAGLILATTSAAMILSAAPGKGAGPDLHPAGHLESGELVAASPALTNTVYLPLITHNFCRDFLKDYFDDFTDPYSGWFTGDDAYVRSEYINEEYRIFTKQSGFFYLYRAPTCSRDHYSVAVSARWVGTPGSSYGLLFGLAHDYSSYYLFDMNTDVRKYRLLRRDPSGFSVVVPATASPAINADTAANRLQVIRQGSRIALAINGSVLYDRYDFPGGERKDVGLVASPYSKQPNADARFDNYQVTRLTAATAGQAALPGADSSPSPTSGGGPISFSEPLLDLPAWDAAGP